MVASNETIAKFYDDLSAKWWDRDGPQNIIHLLYDVTYSYIWKKMASLANNSLGPVRSFEDLKVLDIGCGGGILTERLAKDGVGVTGIDINENLINVAKDHAYLDSTIGNRLYYFAESIEQHANTNEEKYDVIFLNFVLTYVTDKESFIETCVKCLKPNGYMFVTNESKSWSSWLYYICLLHKVLGIFPEEYSYWESFIAADDLSLIFKNKGCTVEEVRGVYYNFWKDRYYWLPTASLDYVLCARKN
ncbi:hypothetical protein RI129_005128 [Pyrocoelia pectoralis]|uniref:3-demethylubiquinol 3-O-methyltransferase n=1 Tax=Pyrocoelia pectoralis TaxID=417401 RepID=A0AAN7VM59_9COLE